MESTYSIYFQTSLNILFQLLMIQKKTNIIIQIIYYIIQMQKILKKKRKLKTSKDQEQNYQNAKQQSFADNENSMNNNDLSVALQHHNQDRQNNEKQLKALDQKSDQKLRPVDDITMGGESVDESLPKPYQFLKFANPPLHTIFLPHFTPKSMNFILSIIFIIAFLVLIIYSYTKPIQNDLTWNCSIFQLQNKYYPRLRFDYQFWRVFVSGIFHSNIAHFILNLLGLQIYGYFVQWYYGRLKYGLTALFSIITAHFLSCISLPQTVSTMPSSVLFSILVLKAFFLYEYREYKPLINRRIFIYALLILIFAINLIPIFVNNNVDFTGHIAGLIVGFLMGLFFHLQKSEQQLSKPKKIIKYGSLVLIFILNVICIALIFALEDERGQFQALNDNIAIKCAEARRRVLINLGNQI